MRFKYGMVHGRFQPFHLEHLRYFRLAWEQSENVLVGITNPDPSSIQENELNPHRHLQEENPFTFTERLMMIQETLREEGYPMERIFLVPLPIHHPNRWGYYIPPGTAMFVVIYSAWETQKAERFREAGLEVVVEDSLKKDNLSLPPDNILLFHGDSMDDGLHETIRKQTGVGFEEFDLFYTYLTMQEEFAELIARKAKKGAIFMVYGLSKVMPRFEGLDLLTPEKPMEDILALYQKIY